MCCPSTTVVESDPKRFLALVWRLRVTHKTRSAPDQCHNGLSNLLTSYREQSQSTRIVVVYPRPALSATKRTNHALISFDQQAQVSQDHTSYYINNENCNIEVHGGEGLEPVKFLRPSIQPSKALCVPKKRPENRIGSPLLVGFRRKKTDRGQRSVFPSDSPGLRL